VRQHVGSETLDFALDDVLAELRERTDGRGRHVCIEADDTGPQNLYEQAKQELRLQTDRPTALREAIYACRKRERRLTVAMQR